MSRSTYGCLSFAHGGKLYIPPGWYFHFEFASTQMDVSEKEKNRCAKHACLRKEAMVKCMKSIIYDYIILFFTLRESRGSVFI